MKSLSLNLAPHGIPVNAIAPNYLYRETYFPRARFIDDPAGQAFIRQGVPVGRLAEPEEIGELIRLLIFRVAGPWPPLCPA
ncbi:MAG: SDR family oxidoreductase [Chloroflexaceae bacterium]|nr:SDR family oxidoreductase [Chloroflexaceae bacterium]